MDLPKHPDQLLNGPVQRLHGRPPHRPDAAARKPLQRVSVLDEPRPRAADAVDCDLAQARSPGEREVAAVGQRPLPHLAEEELPPPPRRALSGGSVLAAIHARAHKTTQTRARARTEDPLTVGGSSLLGQAAAVGGHSARERRYASGGNGTCPSAR